MEHPNLYKVNPYILLVENLVGINDTVVNCIRNLYADKIQKNARTFLCKRNYIRKKLIKHINIISTFPPNVNPQALKIYFRASLLFSYFKSPRELGPSCL